MPEAGFDPGIDLVILARVLSAFDHVETLNSYGSGIPAPECKDTNVLNYKISWSWEGVLAAYWRPARVIANGAEVVAAREEIFRPAWRHEVTVEGVGPLEAYVNGDAVAVAELAGIRGHGPARRALHLALAGSLRFLAEGGGARAARRYAPR